MDVVVAEKNLLRKISHEKLSREWMWLHYYYWKKWEFPGYNNSVGNLTVNYLIYILTTLVAGVSLVCQNARPPVM